MNQAERLFHLQSCHQVFSFQASHHFNRRMRGLLNDMTRDLAHVFGDNLLSLVMGGTYGRGEGRIRRGKACAGAGLWSGGEVPADDLDLLVLLKAPAYDQAAFGTVCAKYQEISGMDLVVMGVLTPSQLSRIRPDIHWHELSRHHKILWGDPEVAQEVLACLALEPSPPDCRTPSAERYIDGSRLTEPAGAGRVPVVGLRTEACRLVGECLGQALETLLEMQSESTEKLHKKWERRLYKGRTRIVSALLLAEGQVPVALEKDAENLARIAPGPDVRRTELFVRVARLVLGAGSGSMFRLEPIDREVLGQEWLSYLGLLDEVADFLERNGSGAVRIGWQQGPDWVEPRRLLQSIVRLAGKLDSDQAASLRDCVARIAGRY